jgi:hypothetical protein
LSSLSNAFRTPSIIVSMGGRDTEEAKLIVKWGRTKHRTCLYWRSITRGNLRELIHTRSSGRIVAGAVDRCGRLCPHSAEHRKEDVAYSPRHPVSLATCTTTRQCPHTGPRGSGKAWTVSMKSRTKEGSTDMQTGKGRKDHSREAGIEHSLATSSVGGLAC